MGFPLDMFPVLFAIPRTAGWLAQWDEMLRDPDQKIARPRQIYIGAEPRDYVPRDSRGRVTADPRVRPRGTARMIKPLAFVVILGVAFAGLLNYMADRRAPQPSHKRRRTPTPPAQAQAAAAEGSTAAVRGSTCARWWRSARARPAHRRSARRAPTSPGRSAALGLTVEEQPFTAPDAQWPVEMVNLIVRLPGKRPDNASCSRATTTRSCSRTSRFVGASDGGSSAAFLIELARVAQGPAARVHLRVRLVRRRRSRLRGLG